jgi:hypothetical protein
VLGLSKLYSRKEDVVDVLAVISAFEEMNNCSIHIRLFTQATKKAKVLQVLLSAWEGQYESPEAKHLASYQSTWGFFDPKSLESVILQGLYHLDARLGEAALVRDDSK